MSDKIINCEFEYKCPLKWDDLQKQQNGNIRFCSSCEKNVYFANSQNELDELVKAGKCVAFNQPTENDIFNNIPRPTMGIVAPPPDFFQPPPPPPERIPSMGLPSLPPKKKSWWKFWI